MRTFQTTDGQTWTIDLNIEAARELRAQMKDVETLKDVDFLDYAALLTSLTDVFFAADLLYLVCQAEAQQRGIDAAAFGRLLKGSILFDGIAAFTAEYIDFFPNPAIAEKMKAFAAKMETAQSALIDAISARAEAEVGKIVDALGKESGTRSSNASPFQAETTPEFKL